MRKTSLLFVSLLFATSLFAQTTPTSTTGDDLAQALINHGMDPASAPTFAAVLELAISQSNALSQRITDAQTTATGAKTQADATQATASNLQTRMASAENTLVSMTASLGSISTTLATTQNQAAAATAAAQDASNKVGADDQNISSLNTLFANLEQRVTTLEKAAAPPPPPALVHVEAETATGIPSANVITLATASGGKYVGNIAAGQTFTYTVAVPAAGNYLLSASIASPVATAQFHFVMNGVASPVITIPSTGDYHVFKPVSAPQLASFSGPATVTLQIVANTTPFNVDFFELAQQ